MTSGVVGWRGGVLSEAEVGRGRVWPLEDLETGMGAPASPESPQLIWLQS